jgi:hypothetical protein
MVIVDGVGVLQVRQEAPPLMGCHAAASMSFPDDVDELRCNIP